MKYLLMMMIAFPVLAGDLYDSVVTLMKAKQYDAAWTIAQVEIKKDRESPKWNYVLGYMSEKNGLKERAFHHYVMAAMATKTNARDLAQGGLAADRLIIMRPDIGRLLKIARTLERDRDAVVRAAAPLIYAQALKTSGPKLGTYTVHFNEAYSATYHYSKNDLTLVEVNRDGRRYPKNLRLEEWEITIGGIIHCWHHSQKARDPDSYLEFSTVAATQYSYPGKKLMKILEVSFK